MVCHHHHHHDHGVKPSPVNILYPADYDYTERRRRRWLKVGRCYGGWNKGEKNVPVPGGDIILDLTEVCLMIQSRFSGLCHL